MINHGRLIALIPARGGSKRMPDKNILPLGAKPMLAWSIEAGLKSRYVDRVVVSSDSEQIITAAKKHGAEVPFIRPNYLAGDKAALIDVVLHALDNLHEKYEYLALLQPTSPLRNARHIDEAVELLIKNNADGIIGVSKIRHPYEWVHTLPEDFSMDEFLSHVTLDKRSQDLPVRYRINGAIYLVKTKIILSGRSMFAAENFFAYDMAPEHAIDVDTAFDFRLAGFFLNLNQT